MANVCNSYCWWNFIETTKGEDESESLKVKINLNEDPDVSAEDFHEDSHEPAKQRRRRSNLPNIDRNLKKLLSLINESKEIEFEHNDKSSRGLHNGQSDRRSRFIGVLKNGHRWQVLINVGKMKKYIGTFWDEKEAALVHDFYCIGINGKRAKTNFKYDSSMLLNMITSYYNSEKVFNPSLFARFV